MFKSIIRAIGGDPNKRDIQRFSEIVERINALEPNLRGLSNADLLAKTGEFRARIGERTQGIADDKARDEAAQAALDDLLPEAFAAVREASMRSVGMRHFDVQLIGGIVLHRGKIAEMRTGEGKTLVATLPLYLNALLGRGAHLVTVNDYLARRDAKWMGPIFHALGMTVGVLQEAARTENGKKAFLFDPEHQSAQEDADRLRMVDRREAYAADITYGTNNEFGFDYLRDNMAMRLEDRVQRDRHYAIVDEVDNILIDEARTPLIISGPSHEDPALYEQMAQVVRQLQSGDFEIDERNRSIALTEIGEERLQRLLGQPLRDPDRPEDITPEQARLLGHIEQALRAEYIFKRNKDYLVQGSKVVIVDEFTGRLMPGRRWSDGLHQAVEAKERVPIQAENVTYATITLQNYFRLYQKLAGMTGTALTEAEEFSKIYKLDVIPIPPHLEYMATRPSSDLTEVEFREDGSRFHYFARNDDPQTPVYWRRKDYPDVVFRTEEAKLRAVVAQILSRHARGQPMLIGTTSVESSEHLSQRLRAERLQRLAQTLIVRHAWFAAHDAEEDGRRVDELEFLNRPLEDLTPGDLRAMAKDLGISLSPESPENRSRLLRVLDLPDEPEVGDRLTECLRAGVRHDVLNAKRHAEESQIIAGAGALGAVTIATNMAGRGVDIKLGGELAEEIIASVNRVIKRAGHPDPYNLTMEERRAALEPIGAEAAGIYESEVEYFKQYMRDAARVKELGGLHVIGSERHEARRIDNQLRGRAARQGDPGSSQFYLSLQDELMRRFGGSQVSDLMQRLKIDDAVPIAHSLVNKTIEQSQTRVEGANFDVRKHLLEYDDVLNTQRNKIYEQRDRIFVKDDLSDDLGLMLEQEVHRRVPAALADDEGPWKLLAWLEETQPSVPLHETRIYPSFMLRLLTRDLEAATDAESARAALVEIARHALEAEREHLLHAIEGQIARTAERAEAQIKERREMAEMAIEGVETEAETTGAAVDPRQLATAVGQAVGIELRLDGKTAQEAARDLRRFKEQLVDLAGASVPARLRASLIAAVEHRVGASLNLSRETSADFDWDDEGDGILAAAEKAHGEAIERGLAEIEREVAEPLASAAALTPDLFVRLLIGMAFSRQTVFDPRTHQRQERRAQRLIYVYSAARKIAGESEDELTEAVLDHLRSAWEALRELVGQGEWQRLGARRLSELPESVQSRLRAELGDPAFEAASGGPLNTLPAEMHAPVRRELGRHALNEDHRRLMLSASTQLWVEYLTSVEALRTSIGLEAYGQRDPLVQYKSKAFDMFQELLVNMRAATVGRMFTFFRAPAAAVRPAAPATAVKPSAPAPAGNGKKVPAAKQVAEPAAKAPASLGRNDPCWCGSGKKYKHCHLDSDRAASAPVVSGQAIVSSSGGKRRRRR